MKKIILLLIIAITTLSCTSQTKKDPSKDLLEPSFKEKKNDKEFTEYFDKKSNIYSNYKYNIAVQSPKNWKHDEGVAEHMIFRSFDKDSGYTFSVNVIETKYNIEKLFWKEYEKNKLQIQQQINKVMEQQINSPIETEYFVESYLKNYKALKRKYNYTIKDGTDEFDMTIIMFQVPKDNFTYTISLTIPKIFYDERQKYYEDIVKNIYWLTNKDNINKAVLEMK